MIAIRGATTVEIDSEEDIICATKELIAEIMAKNALAMWDILSIHFTQTVDLRSAYAAKAAREMGILSAALFSAAEPDVVGSLQKTIRVLVYANLTCDQQYAVHCYLKGAEILRPDLKS